MNKELEAEAPEIRKPNTGETQQRANRRRKVLRDTIRALLLLSPLLLGLGLIYYSAVFGLAMSFTSWDIVRPAQYVGLDNFSFMLQDTSFWRAMGNTAYLTFVTVPLKMILGLSVALLCNQGLKGSKFFTLTFFFPNACSVVAIALLWGYIYHRDGILNIVLELLGMESVRWLSADNALNSIAVIIIWSGMGYVALLFLAGLQSIPDVYYDAGKIDGANPLQRLWFITIPLLSPTTFFILVISIITSLQTFGEVYILEGPLNSTLTIVKYIYDEAFSRFRMGYASALALILIVITFLITLVQLRLQRKWVNYEL